MQPFRTHTGLAVPLDRVNIDTDQIIPKQFLKRIERTGFGEFLFHDWRRKPSGEADASFVLNQMRYSGASILISQELRLRFVSRACGLGARRSWLPRGDCAVVCRYFFQQLRE